MALTFGPSLVDEAVSPLRERIGGKGLGLVRLLRHELSVPDFFVVEADHWNAQGALDADLKRELDVAYAALGGGPVAVRSSAVMEDGGEHSFAGQLESYLGVVGAEALHQAVSACMQSGATERVRAYCRERGVVPGPVAVVVQRLIDPDAAGVLFTRDPSKPDHSLISAAWGLGEGVVQGSVPCDTFSVDERGRVEADIDTKDQAVQRVDDHIEARHVPEPKASQRTLSDAMVRRIHRVGRKLEEALGRPQDIEFAVRGHDLFVLQVRPITVPIPVGRKFLWDNSNIVESYSGVTTPMTFSFAQRAYTIAYQLFCEVMGVRQDVIQANQATFKVMIGLVRGRVYYNLNSWYRVLTLLPMYEFNRGAMEQMMGVAEVAADQDAGAELAGWQKTLVHGPRLTRLALTLGWRLLRIDRDTRRFQEDFREAYSRYRGRDLRATDPHELLDIYEELERELLWGWTPPLVNDFFVMIFYGLLRKQCQQLTGDEDTNLHNELLAGEGGLESTEPTIAALKMAAWIRQDGELSAALRSEMSDEEVLVLARSHAKLGPQLHDYLQRYGDRCIDELKLESPSLRDDPRFVIATLRNYLRGQPMDPSRFGENERELRRKAEAQAFSRLSGVKERAFRWILEQTRTRVRERENMRFARTRIFGFVRDLVRAWGWQLQQRGVLDQVDDVFYLRIDEVHEFLRGTAVTTDLRGLAALRKREFQGYREGPKPGERFHTRGMIYVANPFTSNVPTARIEGDAMAGTGCCPGVVEGPVVVLEDPKQGARLDGQILVAERTDPGWVPLYPSISGLLVERGSLLSHSAVVAREMGIPTVVGLRGLTGWIKDGDRVRLDGDAGTVHKLGGEE